MEFETNNNQRFYCAPKCKSEHNNFVNKTRFVKKEKKGFFSWDDYQGKELIV